MTGLKLIEISSLNDFLALRHIRVKLEQRRFVRNIVITYLQTRHPAVTSYRIDVAAESIGYVMLIHAENPIQWIIERLTIDRDHQGEGYAHAVADQLVDMVHDFDNSEMVIARYEPENEQARRLFQRLNFVEQDKKFRGRHIALLEFEFEEVEEEQMEDEEEFEDEEQVDDEEEFEDDEPEEED